MIELMTDKEMKKRSKGISNDMSAKAILERLNAVRDLYEAAKRPSDFHKINGRSSKHFILTLNGKM